MRVVFLSILGEPGSYDPSVYDSIAGRDNEAVWMQDYLKDVPDLDLEVPRLCLGDSIPDPDSADAFILGGSYNSVHDAYPWQKALLGWFPAVERAGKPLFGICGGHQLMAYYFGQPVTKLEGGPAAGTQPVSLTDAGREFALFESLNNPVDFHFANFEQVSGCPADAEVLATTPRLAYAALRYANGWLSTQFHPETTAEILATSWSHSRPDIAKSYRENQNGIRVLRNFLEGVSSGRL
jgi:GMP synthase (glutamine-hydrolysing)